MNERQQALEFWLSQQCGIKFHSLSHLAGDASFRSYSRIIVQDQRYVVMDAPPLLENCVPFIAIANALRGIGVRTPEIFASDVTQGFLLLSDFGDQLYLKELTRGNEKVLYKRALTTLAILQSCQKIEGWELPVFTAQFMRQEMEWFREWFLIRYSDLTLQDTQVLTPFFDWLIDTVSQQPYVFMHRDYHSANLMVLPDNQVGVLDFQDAFLGPVTYDLASLLRDCYIAWPEELIYELAIDYFHQLQDRGVLQVSAEQFLYWFDCMSMQRHLKALITFSRKFLRDHNANYLQYIPRTIDYLMRVSQRYPQSKVLNQFLKATELCEQ